MCQVYGNCRHFGIAQSHLVRDQFDSLHKNQRNKRYYDAFDDNFGQIKEPLDEQSGKKDDPCLNKPLWYLKYQARLGKLSPFYDCLQAYK
ncbi:unnamed protein product [Didymodactylos carnosus]|uniref:Uncharacterized protein n=1 Tax=Didymodactylos carnosus TaxID=1234261 RepID=A0A813Z9D4_9BILA|nr:unnamed protein product [Didymodactylos carnosus]CAF3679488.1 unnamed protein product [Didymodactylos carnosus]